jgi:8-oxo-dGTP pyrophosphatase MutT (NUDIX family)
MIDPLEFEKKLAEILTRRVRVRQQDERRRPSAVLIPLYFKDGRFYLVFTRRTQLVHHHKGEISFPGGAVHPRDPSLRETALRESAEEIGLAERDVRILGELDDFLTRGSPFIITPFVGLIPADYPFVLNSFETAAVIQIPVDCLLAKDCRRDAVEIWEDGSRMSGWVYQYQDQQIIGATARILKQFLELYQQSL